MKIIIDNIETVFIALMGVMLHYISINIPLPYLMHYVMANVFGMILVLSRVKGKQRKYLFPRVVWFGIILGFFLSQGTGHLIGLTDPADIQFMGFFYGAFGWYMFELILGNLDGFMKAMIKRIGGPK